MQGCIHCIENKHIINLLCFLLSGDVEIKMPPTKGPRMKQKPLGFKTVKTAKGIGSRNVTNPKSILSGNKHSDEALLKLRIPLSLCKQLPSVKKYSNSKKSRSRMMNMNSLESLEDIKPAPIFSRWGQRRRRGDQQKYHLRLLSEERFPGMTWDITFLPAGQVVVGTSEGAFLCDADLDNMHKLEHVQQAGGVVVLGDGRFAMICRFSDEVVVYEEDGTICRHFPVPPCSTCMTVNRHNVLLITDTHKRCIYLYSVEGQLLSTIPDTGPGYNFKWPLYISIDENDQLFVSDNHHQCIFVFDKDYNFIRQFPLKTFGGNFVLRPHGVAVNGSDVFVVDRAIDTVEVFTGNGTYLQTLLPSDEGVTCKPKVCAIDHTGSFLLIGNLSGSVRLYQFIDGLTKDDTTPAAMDTTLKVEPGLEKVKEEVTPVKQEPGDVIVLE